MQSECVGRIATHRSKAGISVLRCIAGWKTALPGVGPRWGIALIRLGEGIAGAACGPLPFGFRGQFTTRPAGIGLGILQCDRNHGPLIAARDGRARAAGLAPESAWRVMPPGERVGGLSRIGWRGKDQGARLLKGMRQARQLAGVQTPFGGGALGDRSIARGLHEGRELRIGDFGAIHPEARGCRFSRALFLIDRIAHAIGACRNPDHASRRYCGMG